MCQLVILYIHPTTTSVNFKVRHAVMLWNLLGGKIINWISMQFQFKPLTSGFSVIIENPFELDLTGAPIKCFPLKDQVIPSLDLSQQ